MRKTLIKASQVFTGVGEPVRDGAVLIANDEIVEAGPWDRLRGQEAAKGAQEHDLGDVTVLPGLFNLHGHVGIVWPKRQEPIEMRALRGAKKLYESGLTGVTTFRDNGAIDALNIVIRDAVRNGTLRGPRVLASGRPIARTGGHAYWMAREADGPDEVRKAAREQLKLGADHLKFMATGGIGPNDSPHFVELGEEELRAGIEEAHKLKRLTTAHADGPQGIKNSIRAGIDCIEHGKYLDDECIEMMVDNGVHLVPTFSGTYAIAHGGQKNLGRTAVEEQLAREAEGPHKEGFAKAVERGVLVATGTDSAGNMSLEMRLMMEAGGLTAEQAILAATKWAAEVVGMSKNHGTLEAGKKADLIAVRGNPFTDIRVMERIAFVMIAGSQIGHDHPYAQPDQGKQEQYAVA